MNASYTMKFSLILKKETTKYQSTLKFKVFDKDWDEQNRCTILTSIEVGPECLWAVHHWRWGWKGWEYSEFYLHVCLSELMRINDWGLPVASILVYLMRKVNDGSSTIFSSCLLCSFWDHRMASLSLCTYFKSRSDSSFGRVGGKIHFLSLCPLHTQPPFP